MYELLKQFYSDMEFENITDVKKLAALKKLNNKRI